jgi:predicted MFS family arabinose efflux permease
MHLGGLVALGFIGFLMPTVVSTIKDKIIDYWGAILIITTLVPALLALSLGGSQYNWNAPFILTMFGVAAASLIGFIWAEHKSKEPIIPLSLFKNSIFTTSVIITFLTAAAMFGAIVYIPIFGQLAQGISATASGTILTPLMVGLIGASVVSGQIIAKTGRYRFTALFGVALLVVSLLWLSEITASTSHIQLMIRMVTLGISLGLTMPVFNIAVQNAFEQSKIGVVTASTQLFRSIGGTVGTAVLGAVFNNTLERNSAALSTTAYGQLLTAHGQAVTNPNVIEGMLSPQGQSKVLSGLSALPAAAQPAARTSFTSFLTAISHLFLMSAFVASVALIVTLFLKEIPLKQAKKSSPTQSGEELATELGQSESKDEPVLI